MWSTRVLNCQPLHPIRLLDFRPFQPTNNQKTCCKNVEPSIWKFAKFPLDCLWITHKKHTRTIQLSINSRPISTSLNLIPIRLPCNTRTFSGPRGRFRCANSYSRIWGIRSIFVYFCCLPQIFGRKKEPKKCSFIYEFPQCVWDLLSRCWRYCVSIDPRLFSGCKDSSPSAIDLDKECWIRYQTKHGNIKSTWKDEKKLWFQIQLICSFVVLDYLLLQMDSHGEIKWTLGEAPRWAWFLHWLESIHEKREAIDAALCTHDLNHYSVSFLW